MTEWANPFIDPDKPMTSYRVTIVCDAQLTEPQFVELVHHWLETPGIAEAGFDLEEPVDELRALQATHRDICTLYDSLRNQWNRLNLAVALLVRLIDEEPTYLGDHDRAIRDAAIAVAHWVNPSAHGELPHDTVLAVLAPEAQFERRGRAVLLDCLERLDPNEAGLSDEVRAERRGFNIALNDVASISQGLDAQSQGCSRCGHLQEEHVFRVLADGYTDCRIHGCHCERWATR